MCRDVEEENVSYLFIYYIIIYDDIKKMINQFLYNNKLQRRGFYLNQGPCESNYIFLLYIPNYIIFVLFFLLRIIEVKFNHETPPYTRKR